MSVQAKLMGVIVLYDWLAVSIGANSSTAPNFINNASSYTAFGASNLVIYLVLPSGVNASIKINNNTIPLSSGYTILPINNNDVISTITFTNTTASTQTAIVSARLEGV